MAAETTIYRRIHGIATDRELALLRPDLRLHREPLGALIKLPRPEGLHEGLGFFQGWDPLLSPTRVIAERLGEGVESAPSLANAADLNLLPSIVSLEDKPLSSFSFPPVNFHFPITFQPIGASGYRVRLQVYSTWKAVVSASLERQRLRQAGRHDAYEDPHQEHRCAGVRH